MFSWLGVYTVWVPLLIQLIGMHSVVYSEYDTVRNVTFCPITERGWKIRKNDFNCKEGQLLAYHCLLDEKGQPKEVCLKRKEYAEGCPWVLLRGERGYFGNPVTSCKNNKYCPDGTKRFNSDQLYIYPACFVKESKRGNYTPPKVFEIPEIAIENSKNQSTSCVCEHPYQICTPCQCEDIIWIILVVSVIVSVIVMIGIVGCILLIRFRRKDTKQRRAVHAKENLYLQMILRSVIHIIKSGDDPSLLEDIYDTLDGAQTETHIYEENFPEFEDKKVPYLIYAAKLNRLQIVHFYLRQYLDGSNVCLSDVYGSEYKHMKHMNIMHIAIQNDWPNVVEKLLDINHDYFLRSSNVDPLLLAKSLNRHDIVQILQNRQTTVED